MATAAKALGQGNAVEFRARTQAYLHALGACVPHQCKAAALAREDVAHLAVEHAGAVDHQALKTIEGQHLCAIGDVFTQTLELLIHRTAARHEGGFLLRREGGNLSPALKGTWLHVQCRQERSAFCKFPLPDVAVFDVLDQAGHGLFGVEELPGQLGTRLVHVKVHHAAVALVALQLFGRALVVVQHHQLANLGFNGSQQFGAKGKVHHIDRAAIELAQVFHGLDFTVVQPPVFGLVTKVQPRSQRRAKAVRTATTVVEDVGARIVFQRWLHQQLQRKNVFSHVVAIVAARWCLRTAQGFRPRRTQALHASLECFDFATSCLLCMQMRPETMRNQKLAIHTDTTCTGICTFTYIPFAQTVSTGRPIMTSSSYQ